MGSLPLVITIALMLLGVTGSFLPGLPGTPLIWVAAVLYGYMEGWAHVGVAFVVLGALVVAVAAIVEYAARHWGQRAPAGQGAGRLGTLTGAVLGLVLLGPLGLVLGAFCGAVLLELAARRRWRPAMRAGLASLIAPLGARRTALLISLLLVLGFLVKVLGGAA